MFVGVSDNDKCVNDVMVSVCMCRCVKRKVTSPDEELNTILRHPSTLDFTDEILCLTV